MVYKKFRRRQDRRKRNDVLLKILTALGAMTGLIITSAFIVLSKAKPDTFAGLDDEKMPLRSWWNQEYVDILFYLMILGFMCSTVGLIVNSRRLKRKSDSIRLNLVFLWIVSVAGIAAHFYYR